MPLPGEHQGCPVPCVFQEPAYTAADKAFLRGLGHAVVESPAALALVRPDTLVFGVHLPCGLYAAVLESCFPAVLVATPWHVWQQSVGPAPRPVNLT